MIQTLWPSHKSSNHSWIFGLLNIWFDNWSISGWLNWVCLGSGRMTYPLSFQWFINLYPASTLMKCQEMKEFGRFSVWSLITRLSSSSVSARVTQIINDRKYYIRSAKLESTISDNAWKQPPCDDVSYYLQVISHWRHKKLITVKFDKVSNDLLSDSLN